MLLCSCVCLCVRVCICLIWEGSSTCGAVIMAVVLGVPPVGKVVFAFLLGVVTVCVCLCAWTGVLNSRSKGILCYMLLFLSLYLYTFFVTSVA